MHTTSYEGITFYEGRPNDYQPIEPLKIEIGGILLTQSQLKTLKDVKHEMAMRATKVGGNAIVDFKYGQKSVGFLRSILQMDDVNWYGEGMIARVPE